MTRAPPKPLSEAGRRKVLKIARGHRQLGPVLGGRGRAVVVEPDLAAREGPEGQVLLGLYDYERGRTLVAKVDPAAGRVLSVEEAAAPFQLSDEEREEAAGLAAADERVRRFLRRRAMNPLTRLYFPPGGGPHRYAIVFLRPSGRERAYAIVDLSERRVVELLSREQFTGEEG